MLTHNRLKNITLVFENCESMEIPGEFVKYIHINDISETGYGWNLSGKAGWYEVTKHSDDIRLKISKDFLDMPFVSFDGRKTNKTNYQRLIAWKDITWIYVKNSQYKFVLLKGFLKRLFGNHKISWKTHDNEYRYSVPWYFNEDDEKTRTNNKWQSIKTDNKGAIVITIKKEKS